MKQPWLKILDLRSSADYGGTVTTISEGVSLRGYNLWLLLCAAILSSIGLDTNSAAIIIGAMLISPLMSPILGIGLSIAINDKNLLLRSIRNLLFAIAISLCSSVLYFLVTPLGFQTEQLQARTYPTLLDVLVALFGGLAGIISISRRGPTNAIPGVAIATALMPPLCTAGFGIATGNLKFFAGAFYLFVINAVFISMATFLIVKYLHFPMLKPANKSGRKAYSFWFALISIIALIPSIYFLFNLYQNELIRQRITTIVIDPIKYRGNEILKWELQNKDSVTLIKVYHSGKALTDSLKKEMDSALQKSGLFNYHLQAMRVNLTKEEVTHLSADVVQQMFAEMHIQELIQNHQPKDTLSLLQVWNEAKPLFPEIDSAGNGWTIVPQLNRIDTIVSFTYFSKTSLSNKRQFQLISYLKTRLNRDSVILNFKSNSIKKKF